MCFITAENDSQASGLILLPSQERGVVSAMATDLQLSENFGVNFDNFMVVVKY